MAGGRTVEDLQRQAARVGATLVSAEYDRHGTLIGQLDVPDYEEGAPMNTAVLLENLTDSDEQVGAIPEELVEYARRAGPAALQAWVQENVPFADEAVETFMSPTALLQQGAGDCDDSERFYVAVARAAGWQARLVYFTQDGQPAHVSAQVLASASPGAPKAWAWAETTIAARFGEHPFAALKRLGIRRTDIDGTPFVLQNGTMVPLRGFTLRGFTLRGLKGMMTMKGMGQAAWPSYLGDTFAQSLVDQSATLGANPLDILKLLISESGGALQPSAWNPRGFSAGQGAVGINQLAPVNYGYITNAGYTVDSYKQLTAEQQLPVVFAYFQNVMRGAGLTSISGRDLYWLNFLPATYVADAPDDYVIVSSSSGYYTNNSGMDHGSKGYISPGDLQIMLDASMNTNIWSIVSPAVLEDSPTAGASAPVAGLLCAIGFAVGAYLSDPGFVESLVRG